LYNTDGANGGGIFYPVTDDTWQEETVTWSNAPTADIQDLATLLDVDPNTWYEVNLTSHITADGTYSLRVSNSTGGADYSSKEGSNDPKLLVAVAGATPQSCPGAATATPTSGATNTPTRTPTSGPSPTPTSTFTPTAAPSATQPPPGAFNNATFVYDGDGKRVKSVFNSATTTYFVGAHYEVTNPGANQTITKYYYAGSQRIALRTNGTLNYLLGDHLGSTSLVTDATGYEPIETRYKAWGETRYASGATSTKYTYTGQYSNTSDFGLMFYNARWYDPALGRFAQADTIVSGKEKGANPYLIVSYNETDFLNQLNQRNTEVLTELRGEKDKKVEQVNIDSQGYDRFSYTNNNPVNFNDPTGHCLGPSSVACMGALLPTGPIGWVLIGGLVILNVALIGNIVDTWDVTTTTTATETTTLDLVVTARKGDLQEVKNVADKFGLTRQEREAFGKFLEDLKQHGQGGSANERGDFTREELEEKAQEFLEENQGE
jgi:RHS repeat-associated protein